MTILAEIYGDPIFFGSGPGFVNRTQSDPGFVNPVRSGPGFVNPIRSDPVLGPVSRKPRKVFGPVKPFLNHLYLLTEKCIRLKLLV